MGKLGKKIIIKVGSLKVCLFKGVFFMIINNLKGDILLIIIVWVLFLYNIYVCIFEVLIIEFVNNLLFFIN